MKHLCIVTPKYPSSVDRTALTFVQQFAWAMAEKIDTISVICPLPINQNVDYNRIPDKIEEKTASGKVVHVFHPKYITFGQVNLAFFNTAPLTTNLFSKAVSKVLDSMIQKPDVLYGHFFTPAGVSCAQLGEKYKIPSFIAYGESMPWTIKHLGSERTKRLVANVTGVISVSSYNKVELLKTGVVDASKIEVFPNGFLSSRFRPKDKDAARIKFGFDKNAFIVCFVGHFIERKGISILKKAIDQIENCYLICAGKGKLKPKGNNVLYADDVNPDDLADFYSSADIFVLPTLSEGCCNSIIEAMACGLPVISSSLPFNDDILDDTNSIRIDPLDVKAIVNAVDSLKKNNQKKILMGQASLNKAKRLTLEARTDNIVKFIEERIK